MKVYVFIDYNEEFVKVFANEGEAKAFADGYTFGYDETELDYEIVEKEITDYSK